MNKSLLLALGCMACSSSFALNAPQPTNCVSFEAVAGWNGAITMTNHCDTAIDLRNGLLQFDSSVKPESTDFWGDFGHIAYPKNTSLAVTPDDNGYQLAASLQFAQGSQWYQPNTMLPVNANITIQFSSTPDAQLSNITFIANNPTPPAKKNGEIDFKLPANPGNGTAHASIKIVGSNGFDQTINQASWGQVYSLKQLPYGQYTITVNPLQEGQQTFNGTATPASLNIENQQPQNVAINYKMVAATGSLSLQVASAQPENNIAKPVFHVKDLATGKVTDQSVAWNASTTVAGLVAGDQYAISADPVMGKSHEYQAEFLGDNPVTINANVTTPEKVLFKAQPVTTDDINANVTGLPAGQQLTVTFKDNFDHTFQVTGQADEHKLISLPVGRAYTVAAAAVTVNDKTYYPTITPNQFSLAPNHPQTLSIQYQPQTQGNFVAYWAGWNNISLEDTIANTKVNVVDLAFADIQPNGQDGFTIDTSVSGRLTDIPKANTQIMPEYLVWTNYKYQHPNTKFMLSIGGATFSHIWSNLLTPQNVDAIAKAIVATLNTSYPVYQGNIATPNAIIGHVTLDGVDLDAEAAGRMTAQQAANLVALIKAIKAKAPEKLITLAGFSTGAGDGQDDRTCTVPGSAHCGEIVPVLQQAGNDLAWVNVMAYDAGEDFAQGGYKQAMQNYAGIIGKGKAYLGLDLQAQWGVPQPETTAALAAKAGWAKDNQYGGIMFWAIMNNNPSAKTYIDTINTQW